MPINAKSHKEMRPNVLFITYFFSDGIYVLINSYVFVSACAWSVIDRFAKQKVAARK